MARDDVGQRRRIAAIADIGHFKSGALEEQRHRKMRQAAIAAFGIRQGWWVAISPRR